MPQQSSDTLIRLGERGPAKEGTHLTVKERGSCYHGKELSILLRLAE